MREDNKSNERCGWGKWIFIFVSLVIAIGSLTISLLFLQKKQWKFELCDLEQTQQHFSSNSGIESCLEWRNLGYTESGVYYISPDDELPAMKTYCDMTSSEGGWTLVATINENDIFDECGIGDKWSGETSSFQLFNPIGFFNNWINYNTFGTIESITSQDYKNRAYYSLPASDVLIWQVQNNVRIQDIDEQAFLKYHTNDQFLDNFGSTLYSFYSQTDSFQYRLTEETLVDIAIALSGVIANIIPGWYSYNYDGTKSNIEDGGFDLYDTGNEVSFSINNGSYTIIDYDTEYRSESLGYILNSRTTHPFLAIAWIENQNNRINDFSLRVVSDTGADSDGYIINMEGAFTTKGVDVTWRFLEIVNSSDPVLGELFFTFTSSKWNSSQPNITYPSWSTDQGNLEEEINVKNITNLAIGYLLLSRLPSHRNITREEVTFLLDYIASITSRIELDEMEISQYSSSVTFTKGNAGDVMSRVATSFRNEVEAGYIEFGPMSNTEFPYGLCPGLRTLSRTAVSANCIGTINSNYRNCNDFADWIGGSVPEENVTEYSRSISDIDSSVLIFTR